MVFNLVPYYSAVPQKYGLWAQTSAKFKVWPCIFDILLHHEREDNCPILMKLFDENEAVANVLFTTGPTDTSAIAKLCLMYQLLDCLNVRNTEEHEVKSKKYLKP